MFLCVNHVPTLPFLCLILLKSGGKSLPLFYKGSHLKTVHFFFAVAYPRHFQNRVDSYRYGFNGMEKDDEVKGNGNSYTTQFRQYDPRIGRWMSVDALTDKFPELSPYQFADNTPLWATDIDGLEAFFIHGMASSPNKWRTPEFKAVKKTLKQ